MRPLTPLRTLLGALTLSFQLLAASEPSYLPFHSTLVQPLSMITQLESACWIGASGERCELLEEPIAIDLVQCQQLPLVGPANFKPHQLAIRIKRCFEVLARGQLRSNDATHPLHTQTGMPAIAVATIQGLSLAANNEQEPSPQSCHFPQSTGIDASLRHHRVEPQPNSLTFLLECANSSLGSITLQISCPSVEFGDSGFGAPFFVVPHLPHFAISQVKP